MRLITALAFSAAITSAHAQNFSATVSSRTLGEFVLTLELQSLPTMFAEQHASLWQEEIDHGVPGDWFCTRSVFFPKAAKAVLVLRNAQGAEVDRREVEFPLAVREQEPSREGAACAPVDMNGNQTFGAGGAWGYQSFKIDDRTLTVGWLPQYARTTGVLRGVTRGAYGLSQANLAGLIESTAGRVSFSVTRVRTSPGHGYPSVSTLEHGESRFIEE